MFPGASCGCITNRGPRGHLSLLPPGQETRPSLPPSIHGHWRTGLGCDPARTKFHLCPEQGFITVTLQRACRAACPLGTPKSPAKQALFVLSRVNKCKPSSTALLEYSEPECFLILETRVLESILAPHFLFLGLGSNVEEEGDE